MKYLIINADDFGLSNEINSAVLLAHQKGILTSASLMINEKAAKEAVSIAKDNPQLGVGIHLSLVQGFPALPRTEISSIVNPSGKFSSNPVVSGLRFFFLKKCREAIEKELEAQITKFLDTGLVPTHVDGHLNIHMHPTVIGILVPLLKKYNISAIRVPTESIKLHLTLDSQNAISKITHGIIFALLGKRAKKQLARANIRYPDWTFGLLQSGHMTKEFVMKIIPRLKRRVTEMGFHIAKKELPAKIGAPDYHYTEELNTLLDPEIKKLIQKENIQLANYGTLRKIEEP